MSSYLVAFIVSDFGSTNSSIVNSGVDKHPIEVNTNPCVVSCHVDKHPPLLFIEVNTNHCVVNSGVDNPPPPSDVNSTIQLTTLLMPKDLVIIKYTKVCLR